MTTRSIDIAAFLHLCGVEPTNIAMIEAEANVREFTYDDVIAAPLVRAFMNNASVPVRAFAEARATMKGLSPGRHKATWHQQTAFGRALSQALQQGRAHSGVDR